MEKAPEQEISPEYRIRACLSLDELYFVLRDLGEIKGKKRTYTAEEQIDHITKAVFAHQHGIAVGVDMELGQVTNTFGIRNKARALISRLPVDTRYSRQES